MVEYVKGSNLPPALQSEALARYVHRFTGEHVPQWARQARPCGRRYPVQFRTDREWLENTYFPVTKTGRLARRPSDCRSRPTWPEGRA